jgi:hypothetical protein
MPSVALLKLFNTSVEPEFHAAAHETQRLPGSIGTDYFAFIARTNDAIGIRL